MKKILTLDGGGIRGIIPASIIAYLEERLRTEKKEPDLRIADCFDLLAGTSTGGILACLYLTPDKRENSEVPFRPKYTAAEVLDFYLELGPVSFHRDFRQLVMSGLGLFKSRYSEDALYDLARRTMGDCYISEVVKECLITTYEMDKRKALLFSKYNVTQYGTSADYKLCDIARSTSAAPTYFSPAKISARDNSTRHLVDGGVYANNPSMCALVDAVKIWPQLNISDCFMLSIGTGKSTKAYLWENTRRWGYLSWLQPIIDILTSAVAETVNFQMHQLFTATCSPQNYIRIEPPLLNADTRMDNASAKNIKALKEAAQSYIENNSETLNSIVASL